VSSEICRGVVTSIIASLNSSSLCNEEGAPSNVFSKSCSRSEDQRPALMVDDHSSPVIQNSYELCRFFQASRGQFDGGLERSYGAQVDSGQSGVILHCRCRRGTFELSPTVRVERPQIRISSSRKSRKQAQEHPGRAKRLAVPPKPLLWMRRLSMRLVDGV